ncbi:MAG: methylated-DNA--[protein]-cysteine S-methyltransferase [Firmicutes bacterium]|nr:methylated-DNA--[protein]-cysteine S-methyltransferase [Bacillota bacterium]NLL87530.1 methylated-DNA--[protein]-cysteine S-methyltransferase [Bacillota bacterium]
MGVYQYPSPIGTILLSMKSGYFTKIWLSKPNGGDCREAYPALPREFAADFDRYFGGVPVRFAWPLRLDGTPFQNRVWQVLKKIPYGCTTTYKQIGDQLETKGYRAVGSAVGANPLLIVIPCHRAVAAKGMGGFAYGLTVKRFLLELEKAAVK